MYCSNSVYFAQFVCFLLTPYPAVILAKLRINGMNKWTKQRTNDVCICVCLFDCVYTSTHVCMYACMQRGPAKEATAFNAITIQMNNTIQRLGKSHTRTDSRMYEALFLRQQSDVKRGLRELFWIITHQVVVISYPTFRWHHTTDTCTPPTHFPI